MPAPEVLDGMRQPRSVRLEDIRKQTEPALNPSPNVLAPAGVNVYVSRYRRYRVQITAPRTFIGPDGRPLSGGKMHVAEFEDGIFRNNHRDPEVRRLFDEALQSNPYFGHFSPSPQVHFWLASDQAATTEAAKVNAALTTLKTLPREMVEQFVAELRQGEADDHDVAEAPQAQRPTTRPIK